MMALPLTIWAEFAVPFVETQNRVGDEAECRAYVSRFGINYVVILMNDRGQPEMVMTRARDHVIREELLGREVRIRGKVGDREGAGAVRPRLPASPLPD